MKIYRSIFMIAGALAIVAGVTFAAGYRDSVVVHGMQIKAGNGNADIRISSDGTNWLDNITIPTDYAAANFENLYPGKDLLPNGFPIHLQNHSNSPIDLDPYMKIETPSGSQELCDKVMLNLKSSDNHETGFYSLCAWRDGHPGDGWRMTDGNGPQKITQTGSVVWTAYAKVDPSAGNEIQGKTLDVTITFNGIQHQE